MEKKMILREDGFLEIQLDESMVFDEYLYSLIQEDPHCLSCIRDYRKAHHYFFEWLLRYRGFINTSAYIFH